MADSFEIADRFNRDRIIRQCRKRENYWNGNQYLFWSDVAHDWRNPEDFLEEYPQYTIDPSDYAKSVNLYAAHGEAVIAALSTGVPYTKFQPDDADSDVDINTAKAFNSIAEIIQKHNNISYLNTRALYILFNQNYLAAYTYYHEDESFGTVQRPIYESRPVTVTTNICPNCGSDLGGAQSVPQAPGMGQMGQMECPNCGLVEPSPIEQQSEAPFLLREDTLPKGRQKIELYGPTHVAIPFYSAEQKFIPYLILKHEQHYTMMQEIYPDIADKIGPGMGNVAIDRWARLPENYMDRTRAELVTVRQCWFRSWSYNILGYDNPVVAKLKSLYPNGCYAVLVGTELAEAHDENLDDHWTIATSPTSNYIHSEAIGQRLVPIQDMENDLVNLTFDTIRFGVPLTFFDSAILDAEKFKQTRAEPGMMYPVKSSLGKAIQDNFFQTHTATLSKEVDAFEASLMEKAQFVLGSYPSIYGAPAEGGSKTAAEYSMSRAQALQRLQLIWKIMVNFWPKVLEKAVRSYAHNLKEDEAFSQQQANSFINIWVRKADLKGNVGLVEAEASETFPISTAQKRDILIQMIQVNNPDVMAAIFHPENASTVARIIGFPELYIPGDEDRTKQLAEIAQLLAGQPMMPMGAPMGMGGPEMGPEMGMGGPQLQPPGMQLPPQPTIMPEKDIDDHIVHVGVIRAWCNGEVGQSVKVMNPGGYANVVAHLQWHLTMMPAPAPVENPNAPENSEQPAQ